MSLREDFVNRRATALAPLATRLRDHIASLCAGIERIDAITARAKGIERFLLKAAKTKPDGQPKYDDPMSQIQDQVGARIVTFYPKDVDVAALQILKHFRPVEEQKIIPEADDAFGYVGRHFILFFPADVIDVAQKDNTPKFFELQIKTLFQHAWSEGNHDLAYKAVAPLTKEQKRMNAFTAAQAWGADQIFQRLFDELSTTAS